MKSKALVLIVASLLLLAGARETEAAPTLLPLRCENNGVYIHGGVTSQTIETNFGANQLGLPFTNTTTYDFYSPPLASAVAVTTDDKADGMICMSNTDTTGSYSFSATARMQYFDYDPAAGTNLLLADTQPTTSKNVADGVLVDFPLMKQTALFNCTIPAGHLVHVAVIITLTGGNPGSYGELLYNGPTNSSSYADFPQNAAIGFSWPVTPGPMTPPTIVSVSLLADPAAVIQCSGTPGATYLIQATTNLCGASAWKTIGTNVVGTNGLSTFMDLDTTNYSCRFYRASTP
jgi:hypothetical protein